MGKTLPCPKCRQPVSIPAGGQQAAPPNVAGAGTDGSPDIDALLNEFGGEQQNPQGFGPMGGQPGGFPQQGFPPQGFPQQGPAQQGMPHQGMPQQGFQQQGFPQQGFPQQGHPGYGAPRRKMQIDISQYLPKSSWGFALLGAGLGFGLGLFLIFISSFFRLRF